MYNEVALKDKKIRSVQGRTEPQPVFVRYWGVFGFLFLAVGFWTFRKYATEVFPLRLDLLGFLFDGTGMGFPPVRLLFLYIGSLALWAGFLAGAGLLGFRLVRALGLEDSSPLMRLVLAEGAGLAVVSLGTGLLGFAGLLRREVLWAFYGAGVAAALWAGIRQGPWRETMAGGWREFRELWKGSGLGLFKAVLVVLVVFDLVMNFVPEIFYDSQFYHLALPHLYLLEHKIVELPYMNFSKFPQGMEMLFAWGLTLQGDIVAKLLHGMMGPLTLLALLGLCKKIGHVRVWPLAGALFLSIPVVRMILWVTGVDMALVFYTVLALYAVLQWTDSQTLNPWPWAILCGVASGMAASLKYVGGSVVMASCVCALWSFGRQKLLDKKAWTQMFACGAIGVLWVSPWFLRNAIETGNPVYPLLYGVFGGKNLWPEKIARFMSEAGGYKPAGLWGWIRIPWALTVGEPKGMDNTCWLGPTFWVTLPFLFLTPWRERWAQSVLIFTAVNFLATASGTNQARYLLQGYVGLAVLIGAGLARFYDQGWRGFRGLLLLPLLLACLSNGSASLLTAHHGYEPGPVLTGQISRKDYAGVYHRGMNPSPPNRLYDFMETLGPEKKGRVIFVAEEKTYGCPWPYVYGNVYDKTPIVEWNRQNPEPEALYQALQAQGLRYIAYNAYEGMRLASYDLFYWTPEEKENFKKFWQAHVRLVHEDRELFLFEILSTDEAAAQPAVPCPFLDVGRKP